MGNNAKGRAASVVAWSVLKQGEWELVVGATEAGLYFVGGNGVSLDDCRTRNPAAFAGSEWVRDDEPVAPYIREIAEYLEGRRHSFTVRHDLRGTPFQLAVWGALLAIPFGTSVSYSRIAEAIGKPSAVRAVGAAIGANPVLITVPCHRVIGKNGSLTGYRGGLAMKTKLLELEHEAVPAR
ncbi:methylated-DNA--[protein]-cysteine S-methyltransferase [Paenibacillus sp. SCIV0701]|uniref:methylated-DNA--[protein]-cysteine S-methyltransferase n=2 Tax=Paenibacillus soyae TaxID=2969249 RepID=A0A9X2MWN9_9BACL|nr:methylated-DNA--[protein]-cysteine S-methyltransferase [Paenibacillus soyae]